VDKDQARARDRQGIGGPAATEIGSPAASEISSPAASN